MVKTEKGFRALGGVGKFRININRRITINQRTRLNLEKMGQVGPFENLKIRP